MPSFNNIKVDIQKPVEAIPSGNTAEATDELMVEIEIAQLKLAVQEYAIDMKEKGRMFEFALFNKREVRLENNKITFELENELQKVQLFENRADLIAYFRAKFGNNFIIDADIVASVATSQKLLYTPTDKYNYMAEKYPALEELKKKLGLELEF